MAKNLVIVESPAKAKTISGYLGREYEVKSSFGHIRDLPKKSLSVNIVKNFEPEYQISPDKAKVVAELKKAAKGAVVWLASDEDREGEAIAWHISEALKLDPNQVKRIVFHEITESAITEAIKNPRDINSRLVDAQQARRVLDRLVGYELSPVLWKKVRAGLSAGRVQSVAVRLIVEREREIKAFEPESTFKVSAVFVSDGQELEAELSEKLADITAAESFLEKIKDATFSVLAVDQKPGTRSASAPFTTSTLQQEAARRLGFSVRQTMSLAQRLYESGHITYMRTDSTTLSSLAMNSAKEYINKNFGDSYSSPRQYKTKNSSAQEAHEAIRPTSFTSKSAGADSQQQKLYELIWRRTLASQMTAAKVQKTDIRIGISTDERVFISSGEVLTFDGFFRVYGGNKDDKILPAVKVGQNLTRRTVQATETFSRPPARYSEASLVKKLEELGIGRPSTYAPTISTIQDRGYIEKSDLEGQERKIRELSLTGNEISSSELSVTVGADRSKLLPTQLAEIVTDFLVKYFAEIVDYDFTAKAEAELDDIAEGKLAWQQMLDNFYKKFHPLVKNSEKASRAETVQARELGKDPSSGKPILVRFGRYGPVLQLGDNEPDGNKDKDAPKPKFAPLPSGTTMDDVTLEAALPMFQLPRLVGKTADGDEITGDIGRFGPYLKVGSQYISIKGQDPLTITEADARAAIEDKQKAAARRLIADYGMIQVLRGPYGPYVTDGKKNIKVPAKQDPEKLTEAEAKKLIETAPSKSGSKRKFRRRTTKS